MTIIKGRLVAIIKVVGALLAFCIIGVGILSLDKILTPGKTAAETFEEAKMKLMAKEFDDGIYSRRNVVNYLIAGVDKRQGDEKETYGYSRNNVQADFIMLVTVDNSTREISMLNINRDTWTEYEGMGMFGGRITVTSQICLAHTYGDGKDGSADNLRKAVSKLLYGTHIDHYLTLRLDAISIINDYMGGVTLTLGKDEDLSSLNPEWVPGATVTIQGKDAEYWVRARKGVQDQTNISRMSRQNKYIKALLESLGKKAWDAEYLASLNDAIDPYTVSDLKDNLYELNELLDVFGLYIYKDIDTLKGTEGVDVEGYAKFDVDQDALLKYVKQRFFRKIDNDKTK